MEKLKKYFNIQGKYAFEWNDLRAFITVLNVALIMAFGLKVAWFGLIIAIFGLIKDFLTDKRINGIVMHLSNAVLNLFFMFFI